MADDLWQRSGGKEAPHELLSLDMVAAAVPMQLSH